MSSARKRMSVRRAKIESDHAKSRATLSEHHYTVIEALAKNVAEQNTRLRAVIDNVRELAQRGNYSDVLVVLHAADLLHEQFPHREKP